MKFIYVYRISHFKVRYVSNPGHLSYMNKRMNSRMRHGPVRRNYLMYISIYIVQIQTFDIYVSEGSLLNCDISDSAPEYRLSQQLIALVITKFCIVEAREIFASTEKNRSRQKFWFQRNYESVLTELNSV